MTSGHLPASVVLSQRPRTNIYELPDASRDVLGEYIAIVATPVPEATRQSMQYYQAVGQRTIMKMYDQIGGRMALFFDDGAVGGPSGWWLSQESAFGESCLLWCAGSKEHLPQTGWQWQGYLGYYEVDLEVAEKKPEDTPVTSAADLLMNVVGSSMVCCLKGTELFLEHVTTKLASARSAGGGLFATVPEANPVVVEAAGQARSEVPEWQEVEPAEAAPASPAEEGDASLQDLALDEERLKEEVLAAKQSFLESFKESLNRFSAEEESLHEAELAKHHFLEAFSSRCRSKQEKHQRWEFADSALDVEELRILVQESHCSKVEKELQMQQAKHDEDVDRILVQVQSFQQELKSAIKAKQLLDKEKASMQEAHKLELQELQDKLKESNGCEDLLQKLADLEAEKAECKSRLVQAAEALSSHEAALQEALQEATDLRAELVTASTAEEEVARLREELATTIQAQTSSPTQMQQLAEEYQVALADMASLRAGYEQEIDGLQQELQQREASFDEERKRMHQKLQEHEETVRKANHMQDVLSKRVVQLEAKLQQQTLDKKDAAEELEHLRKSSLAEAETAQRLKEAEERAKSAEELLSKTAENFQVSEARRQEAEGMAQELKQRVVQLEAQLKSRSDRPEASPGEPMEPNVDRVSLVRNAPTLPNTPLLETRKVLDARRISSHSGFGSQVTQQ